MKKYYIAPDVEIMSVSLQQMIAGSKDVTVEGLDGFDGYGGDGTGKTPSSRRRNIWEDDEDDF